MEEICDNGIDDDGDGAIDGEDLDCQCKVVTFGTELIPNGDFSQINGCCADLRSSFNCLEDWIPLGGSADYVSDNCLESDLRPDVRALSNQFNSEFNEGYIHSLIGSGFNRHNAEAIGICLETPLTTDSTYQFSLDIANLRIEETDELLLTFYGITDCNDLENYITSAGTTQSFCDKGLPVEKIGTFNTRTLDNSWQTITFEITPETNIAALFYAVDCDFPFAENSISINIVVDNFSLREKIIEEDTVRHFHIAEIIPTGSTYNFHGNILSEPGFYSDTLQTERGCDSLVTLLLIVDTDITEICDNGVDDDGDGFIDAFDADCDCLRNSNMPLRNSIFTEGNPCEGNLRFLLEGADDLQVQWFKDSLPIARTEGGTLFSNETMVDNASGIYHAMVTLTDGNCQLIGPLFFGGLVLNVEKKLTLCAGETYQFGNTLISSAGIYEAFFSGLNFACDSSIILMVNYLEKDTTFIMASIPLRATYNFNGELLRDEGIYTTTLTNEAGCDSILILDLTILPTEDCSNLIDDDNDGLIDIFDPDCPCSLLPESTANLVTTIEINGPNCDKDTELFVEVVTNASYQWYKEAIPIQGAIAPLLSLPSGTEGIARNYQLSIRDPEGNCQLLSIELTEPSHKSAVINATICAGETYLLGTTNFTESGIYTYIIPNEKTGCDSILTLNLEVLETIHGDTLFLQQDLGTTYTFHGISYNQSGIYQTNLTAFNGCDSLVWLNLLLTDPCANLAEFVVEWADTDCKIAANGWLEIQAISGTPPLLYSIDGGNTFHSNNRFENLSTGNYQIVVKNEKGCLGTNFAIIESLGDDFFIELPQDTFLKEGQSLNIGIIHSNFDAKEYLWTSEADIICPDCSTILVNPLKSSTYTLTTTDENGCQASDNIFIEIKPVPKLYIPTAFSPNQDGQNDVFKIETHPEVSAQFNFIKIYNRWGMLVHHQENRGNDSLLKWDGRIKNQLAEMGVYTYLISWQNEFGQTELITGDVTLVK